jgi:hypothetical protein
MKVEPYWLAQTWGFRRLGDVFLIHDAFFAYDGGMRMVVGRRRQLNFRSSQPFLSTSGGFIDRISWNSSLVW